MATTDYSLAHSLPANVEAERSILGAILLDNLAYNQAAEHLKPDDFSLDSHRRIYTRMIDLAESSRPIDMITLVEELDRRKELEAIGDVGYVSGLIDGVPDRPSIEHYVKIVRDKALLRGLIHVANAAIAERHRSERSRRRSPQRRRSGHLPALGKAHRARASGHSGNRQGTLSARSTRCCNAASASPASPPTTPISTR